MKNSPGQPQQQFEFLEERIIQFEDKLLGSIQSD